MRMDTDPAIQQFLDKTADYIEEYGWCQGATRLPTGEVCIIGAWRICIEKEPVLRDDGQFGNKVSAELRNRTSSYSRTASWNDAPGRTKDQVIRMLRGKDLEE